jgi:hypothetical protein
MIEAAVFLCSVTGNMALPWAEAGYRSYCVDVQHSIRADRVEGNIHYVWGDVRTWRPPAGVRVIFGAAFTPCTDVAGSGARDFEKKGGYLLRDAVEMFEAARQAIAWSGAPGFLESSVGFLSSIPHIGKPGHYFDPCDFTQFCPDDNYTKKTCIWPINGFVMPEPARDLSLGVPDDRIHKATPGPGRANFRSATPMGFSRAVFAANRPDKTHSQAA